LPLHDSSIDCIISDIPFGKRHKIAPNLYENMLKEMHRVLRPKGRCVLLTTRSKLLYTSVCQQRNNWTILAKYFVNIGGLDGWIYSLEANATGSQRDGR
jgi:tRNA G10  N-methylase Trm11